MTTARRRLALVCTIAGTALSGCAPAVASYPARAARADSLARVSIMQERTLNTSGIPSNTLGVAPLTVFTTDTTYASLGYGIAALLMIDLGRSHSLTLVERLKLDAVLKELKLAESGRVDTLMAPRVGRLIGARNIVIGAIDLRSSASLRIESHVANSVTGTIGASLTGNSTLTQLFDAEKALAYRLFDVLGVTLTPAERRLVEIRPTRSLAAFLAYSRGARAEALGNFAVAMSNFAQARQLDPGFGVAAQRIATLQGLPEPTIGSSTATASAIQRASSISTDLVNRPAPVTIGTGSDVPVTSRAQLITFTIVVRTP